MRAAACNESEGRWEQVVAVSEWYTVQDVQVILNIGGPSVYSMIKRGTLRGYKVNGVTKVKHDDLVLYIKRRQTGATAIVAGELVIEEIIPEKLAEEAAEAMLPEGSAPEGEDLSFLDE